MKTSVTLSILVPVYNEQYLVRASLERLKLLSDSPLLERIEVIVVDDGSTDRTNAILRDFESAEAANPGGKLNWIFVYHEGNQGKAAAIHTALQRASAELTVIHDADLEYHPLDLLKMVQVFLEEQADAVFGSRFLASEYRRVLFFRHQLGNHFLTLLCNIVSDLNLTDMETCYKMVRTTLLKSIPLVGTRFEIEPEISVKLAKRGARIFEVPIRYAGRTYQEGKKSAGKTAFEPSRRSSVSAFPTTSTRRTPMAARFSAASTALPVSPNGWRMSSGPTSAKKCWKLVRGLVI